MGLFEEKLIKLDPSPAIIEVVFIKIFENVCILQEASFCDLSRKTWLIWSLMMQGK